MQANLRFPNARFSFLALTLAAACSSEPGSESRRGPAGQESEALVNGAPAQRPNFDAGPIDDSLSEVHRNPEVAVSHAESSPPLFLLPERPHTGPLVDHEVKPNPTLVRGPLRADPVLQDSAPQVFGPTALLDFFGQGNTVSPSTITGTPPDTNGAVGPNHFVQTVNGGLAIWNKAGTKVWGSSLLNVLWNGYVGTNAGNLCATNNDGDPVVVYDQLADRWLITQFSVPNNTGPDYQCVAVSKTADPTGAYWLYDFKYAAFNDYGKFGVWPDAYYASFNNFGNSFIGSDFCAYDRAKMLQGLTATQQCFQKGNTIFGVLPVSLDGKVPPPAGEPGFFMNFGSNSLKLWKLQVDWTTPANSKLTGPTSIPVAAFSAACGGGTCIPQPGGNNLDSLADRLMFRLSYRNFGSYEALVVNHSVTANSTSGIRWYEIHNPNGTPSVFQQGTFAPNDGKYRWMGSIAQDQAKDFLVGYSIASGTVNAGIAWAGRLGTDTTGLMAQGETVLDTGAGTETVASRWGDYSNMTVDPTDDCTFWFTTEYYQTTAEFSWDTRIASYKFPNCAANDFSIGVSPAALTVNRGATAAYTVATASTKGTAESVVLNVQDLPAGVSGSFVPASVTAGLSSVLTLTATSGAALTTTPVTFTVIGTAASAVHPATAQVSVGNSTTIPPTVAISAPANGATISGTTTVTATGSPSTGQTLTNLSISIDGATAVQSGSTSPQTYNWDTTAINNGAHTLVATATDADGGSATSTTITVTVKNLPSASVTAPANGATVAGTVSVTATGTSAKGTSLSNLVIKIDGTSVVNGATSPQSFSWDTTTYSNGTHTIVATALDADGGTASSATTTVTVKNLPAVAVTAPANGATVAGTLTVSATAAAPSGTTLTNLAIKIDGTSVANGAASPQSFSWDTTTYSNGTHTIVATALDADGGTASSATTTVTVKNLPAVTVTAPASGSTVAGTVSVSATAAAPSGTTLTNLAIKIDGTSVANGATSPQSFSWDTTTYSNGTHTVVATALDADGGTANSATTTVTIKNLPAVTVTAPADGATVGGTLTVSATAAAPSGTTLTNLAIKIDGTSVANGAASPQSFSWDTTTYSNGTHTIVATALDADGGSKTSTVNVTVSNDFGLSVVPVRVFAAAAVGGQPAVYTVNTTVTGAAASVTLSASGLPAGVSAAFVPGTITAGGSATLTLTAAAGAPSAAATSFTIKGVTAALPSGHTASASVTVVQLPTVSITSPANGASASGVVTVTAAAAADANTSLSRIDLFDGASKIGTGTSGTLSVAWDTTAASAGPHSLTAVAVDAAGDTATSAAVGVVVSNDFSLALSAASATITAGGTAQVTVQVGALGGAAGVTLAASNLPASVTASFDTNPVQPGGTATLTLTGSAAAAASTAQVTVTGTSATAQHAATLALTVLVLPSAVVTSPAALAQLSGTVQVQAAATVSAGTTLAALEIRADDTLIGTAQTGSPASVAWDTTLVPNGAHVLTARVRDAAGNSAASAPVSVVVGNPPQATIASPAAGDILRGVVTVTATAASRGSLSSLEILADGVRLVKGTSSPASFTWDTSTVVNGVHTLTAVATDVGGATATSAPVKVSVQNASGIIRGGCATRGSGWTGLAALLGLLALRRRTRAVTSAKLRQRNR